MLVAFNGTVNIGVGLYGKNFSNSVSASGYGLSDANVLKNLSISNITNGFWVKGDTGGNAAVFDTAAQGDKTVTIQPTFTVTAPDGVALSWTPAQLV